MAPEEVYKNAQYLTGDMALLLLKLEPNNLKGGVGKPDTKEGKELMKEARLMIASTLGDCIEQGDAPRIFKRVLQDAYKHLLHLNEIYKQPQLAHLQEELELFAFQFLQAEKDYNGGALNPATPAGTVLVEEALRTITHMGCSKEMAPKLLLDAMQNEYVYSHKATKVPVISGRYH